MRQGFGRRKRAFSGRMRQARSRPPAPLSLPTPARSLRKDSDIVEQLQLSSPAVLVRHSSRCLLFAGLCGSSTLFLVSSLLHPLFHNSPLSRASFSQCRPRQSSPAPLGDCVPGTLSPRSGLESRSRMLEQESTQLPRNTHLILFASQKNLCSWSSLQILCFEMLVRLRSHVMYRRVHVLSQTLRARL